MESPGLAYLGPPRAIFLYIMGGFTPSLVALVVEFTSQKVVDLLDWLFLVYGSPQHLRSDNGPELVAHKVQDWLADKNCRTIYITPGSLWENAFIESFIGKFRKECLDRYLFFNLREMQTIIEDWQDEYNHYRPHSALGYMTPAAFTAQHARIPLSDHQDRVRV